MGVDLKRMEVAREDAFCLRALEGGVLLEAGLLDAPVIANDFACKDSLLAAPSSSLTLVGPFICLSGPSWLRKP